MYTFPPTSKVLFSSSTFNSPHPATQQVPIPLATTAACEVIPPRTVKIPWAAIIPSISSGEVSSLTKTTFSPFSALSLASSAVKATFPQAAPGEAGNPLAIALVFLSDVASNVGCRSESNCFGSTFKIASSLLNIPSETKSTAIFKAAWAVLLPFVVCKKNNFPSTMVNSISCISL